MIAYTHLLYLGFALALAGLASRLGSRVERSFSTWVTGLGAATVAVAMSRLWGDANGLVLAVVIVLATAACARFDAHWGRSND